MLTNISTTENQQAPERIVLNVIPVGRADVRFNQGEILKGVVQDIRPDGTANLLIEGKMVVAASDTRLSPGQQLYLLSDGFRNGLTHLRAITPQELAQLADSNLAANLRSFGVPAGAEMLLIARALLQHDLSVTQQNILEISRAMNMIGGATERNLAVAVFAMQNNIPLDKNILPLVNQFVSSDGNLARLIQELTQLLTRIETMVRSDSLPSTAPPAATIPGSANPSGAAVLTVTGTGGGEAAPNTASTLVAAGSGAAPAAPGNIVSLNQQVNAAPLTSTAIPAEQAGLNPGTQGGTVLSNAVISGTAGGAATVSMNNSPAVNPILAAITEAAATANVSETSSASTASAAVTAVKPEAANLPAPPPVEPGPAASNIEAAKEIKPAGLTELVKIFRAAFNMAVGRGTGANSPAASDAGAASETKPVNFTEFARILRSVLDMSAGRIGGSGSDINPVLQSMVKDRAMLLDNLRLLTEMIRTNEALIKTPAGQELLARISSLQQQITGQALFNGAAKLNPDVLMNNYYFSFPVEIDKELRYCQLRIQKNAGKQLGEQDNIKLVVSLDTSALGIVMFHIDWHRHGYIQLRGVVETAVAGSFIEKNMGELLRGLGDMDYRVNNLGIKVAGKPEELVLKPLIIEAELDAGNPSSLDIMV